MVTRRHPDPDDLADLAAEVLDPATADELRAHVGSCDACATLLDDAARVRLLLLADDPGPMPTDVWARIEQALATEALATEAAGDPPAPSPGRATTSEVAGDRNGAEVGDAPRKTVIDVSLSKPDEGVPSDRMSNDRAPDDRVTDDRPTAKLRRPVRSMHPTRRQRREEHGGRWSSMRSNVGLGGTLAVAAGVLVMLGIGGLLLRGMLPGESPVTQGLFSVDGDDDRSAPSAMDGAQAQGAARSMIVSTGTNYQPSKLEGQVHQLVQRVQPSAEFRMNDKYDDSSVLGGEEQRSAQVDPPPGAWSSKELAACLAAIDAEDLTPVAVDFARFDGQDVALLVLPSPAGDYEVWAVSRTCSPGADGTQFFQIVRP
jgi:hypothetical protein